MTILELLKLSMLDFYKTATIVKRPDGYYVVSEKSGRNLGGPYKNREDAVRRLRQVEYFKHIKGRK